MPVTKFVPYLISSRFLKHTQEWWQLSGSSSDGSYHAMPEIGALAYLTFSSTPARPGTHLVSGYARLLRYHMEGVGEPDEETWRKIFGVPDTMARLAVARF